MFCFFTFFTKSVNTKYPIERYECGAWIDKYNYHIEELQNRGLERVSYKYDDTTIDFYITTCSGFSSIDLPYSFSGQEQYSLAFCINERSTCWPLASKYSLDYAPYDPKDFTKGIALSLFGQPTSGFYVGDFKNPWKIEYNVICNESQTDVLYPSKSSVSMKESLNEITFELQYSGACPVNEAKTPTPTPMYTPQCEFDARDPTNPLEGISMDLRDLNAGPYGHMFMDNINDKNYWIFYQPCERSKNPANRSDPRWGSVWLCAENMSSCEVLGIVDEYSTIEMEQNKFNRPVYNHILSDTSKKTTVYWTCKSTVPDNRFEFKQGKLSDNDYYFEMTLESQESCVKQMKPPTPQKDQCSLNYLDYNFDASKINGPDYKGYVQEVTVESEFGRTKQRLHFQPCGAIYCPSDASCDQFEDAFIWLCKEGQVGTDLYDCDPYGLWENNATTTFVLAENPDAGIQMYYKGGDYLSAKVVYECDKNMPEGEARLDNTVSVKGTTLTLTVRTKESCGDNDPAQRFTPKWPQKGATPTPTPFVHPQPNLFIENQTHFVIVDLHDADPAVDEQSFLVANNGKIASIKHFYAPYDEYKCPSGYDCKEFANYNATGWVCWTDEKNKDVCFPDASIRNRISMVPLSNDLSEGMTITYNGGYAVDLEINIGCDYNAARDIPLTSGASFQQSHDGNIQLSFDTTSSMVCPREYYKPYVPRYTPTPTPDPDIANNIKWDDDFEEDGHMVELDLRRVPSKVVADVALGTGIKYERNTIVWSPVDQISCPENYDCGEFGPNNVWKCFVGDSGRQCYPIGNAKYGVSLGLAPNQKGIWADASATYNGGISSKTTFLFVCNSSVPESDVWIDPVGELGQTMNKNFLIYVHSSNVCWDKHIDPVYNSVSGGAIFLSIFGIGTIIYIIIGGIITFFVTGQMGIPHGEFWKEFFACVADGAVFIGTCGRMRSANASSYDTI